MGAGRSQRLFGPTDPPGAVCERELADARHWYEYVVAVPPGSAPDEGAAQPHGVFRLDRPGEPLLPVPIAALGEACRCAPGRQSAWLREAREARLAVELLSRPLDRLALLDQIAFFEHVLLAPRRGAVVHRYYLDRRRETVYLVRRLGGEGPALFRLQRVDARPEEIKRTRRWPRPKLTPHDPRSDRMGGAPPDEVAGPFTGDELLRRLPLCTRVEQARRELSELRSASPTNDDALTQLRAEHADAVGRAVGAEQERRVLAAELARLREALAEVRPVLDDWSRLDRECRRLARLLGAARKRGRVDVNELLQRAERFKQLERLELLREAEAEGIDRPPPPPNRASRRTPCGLLDRRPR